MRPPLLKRFSWWHLTLASAVALGFVALAGGAIVVASVADNATSRWVVFSLTPIATVVLALVAARLQRRVDAQGLAEVPHHAGEQR